MRALELNDGACLAYLDEGEGAPILLVHGWAAHSGFFAEARRRLSQSHRVLSVDLRGHGRSSVGSAALTIETLGADLASFAEALDLTDIVAVGWSMGAMALWAAEPRLAPRLSGLVIAEMSPALINNGADWPCGLAGYQASDVERTVADILADWPAHVERFAPRLFSARADGAAPDLLDWTVREMKANDPNSMAAFWRSMAAKDYRAALKRMTTPTLIIRGEDSQTYPDGATAFIAAAMPNATREVYPRAGHAPHLERPDLFDASIKAFARVHQNGADAFTRAQNGA